MGNDYKTKDKFSSIIEAALKVFGEKGYYNATISEIARAAGVSEATIYEYFGSKEDLLFAIPDEITHEAVEMLDRMSSYIKGAENKLRAIVYGYFNLYKDNPDYSSLVLLDLKHNRKFMDAEGYRTVRRAAGFIPDKVTLLTDTTPTKGVGAVQDTYTLLRKGTRKLLKALGYHLPGKRRGLGEQVRSWSPPTWIRIKGPRSIGRTRNSARNTCRPSSKT